MPTAGWTACGRAPLGPVKLHQVTIKFLINHPRIRPSPTEIQRSRSPLVQSPRGRAAARASRRALRRTRAAYAPRRAPARQATPLRYLGTSAGPGRVAATGFAASRGKVVGAFGGSPGRRRRAVHERVRACRGLRRRSRRAIAPRACTARRPSHAHLLAASLDGISAASPANLPQAPRHLGSPLQQHVTRAAADMHE